MGLGAFPASDPQFLGMLGMHGTLEANLAMHHADLVVCVGARFDDRVTGKLSDFCPGAKKIHLDIDASSINKVVKVDVALVGDCADLLDALEKELAPDGIRSGSAGRMVVAIAHWRPRILLALLPAQDCILPQQLMHSLQEALAGRDAIVSDRRWPASDVGRAVSQVRASPNAGSPLAAPARWATACRRRSAPRSRIRTSWWSASAATPPC